MMDMMDKSAREMKFRYGAADTAGRLNAKNRRDEMMSDILKKAILFGVGLASMTREKVESFVDEMIKRGEISEKEGSQLVDDLVTNVKKARQDLEEQVNKAVEKAMERLNIPQRHEIEKIRERLEELEKSSNLRRGDDGR